MQRHLFFWLSLTVMLLAACQPIRPESELTPSTEAPATTTVTTTTEITSTTTITDTTEITETTEVTESTPSTPTTMGAGTSTSTDTRTSTEASATSCPAIVDGELDISIAANWEEGEQRHYMVSGTRIDIAGDDESLTLSAVTPVTVTIISVDDDGYTLQWDYGQAELGETDVEMPDPIAQIFEAPLHIRTTYMADNDGAYVELTNIDDLRAQIEPLFDQVFEAFVEIEGDLDPAALEVAEGLVSQLIDDPANFESLFTREIQLFHTLHGFYFENAEPMVLPDMRPNLLGGSMIPSELTITPTHYDADLGCLHVDFANIADPVAARNSILEALQEQAEQMGVPGPEDADLPETMDLIDEISFEIDLNSGWPNAIYLERTTGFGPEGRVETTEIVLVEPDTE